MLDTLKVASAIELGRGAGMYESYVRGEAYLMLHEGKAGEFQKFMEHWGLVGNYPLAVLASPAHVILWSRYS